jgi:aspartate-semialdehyde dehydrogenase
MISQLEGESDRPPSGQKLRVGILGATGAVGQKFVRLLDDHPWFEVTAVAASSRSQGLRYEDAVRWLEPTPLPAWAGGLRVEAPSPGLPCDFVFSALDSETASEVEPLFVDAGIPVISNAGSFRMRTGVPLLIPEVNPDHLQLLARPLEGERDRPPQGGEKGAFEEGEVGPAFLVTNPNCSTTGLALALKPLADAFTITRVSVTTLQAVSGAGYPGVSSMDILGNVLPEIPGEEEKLETEPLKILGTVLGQKDGPDGRISLEPAHITISAQCNRVPVQEGHLLSVSVGFEEEVGVEEAREALEGFESPLKGLGLPSAPERPIRFSDAEAFPQPRLHSGEAGGMRVTVGRLRKCPVLDLRFVALVHNTVRGAAGGAILNAELLRARGLLPGREG